MEQHKKFNLIGIYCLFIVFAVTVVINGLNGALGGEIPLFQNSVGNLSDKYETYITPAGWTFGIWSLIYIWLAITFIFYMITTCLKNSYGGKLYLNPEVASPVYLVVFILNLLANIAWIFLWDNEVLIASSVFLFIIAVTNIFTLALLSWNLAIRNNSIKAEQPKIYWTYVILAQNGPAVYTTWTIIASLLNLIHAMHYGGSVSMLTSCYISLGILTGVICLWSLAENTFLDKWARFIITPYLVVIWACAGIISKKRSDPEVPTAIKAFIYVIVALASIFFLIKMVVLVFRQKRKPLVYA